MPKAKRQYRTWDRIENQKPHDLTQARERTCISKIHPRCVGKFMSHDPGHRMCRFCRDKAKSFGSYIEAPGFGE